MKRIFITGVSSGIGFALAKAYLDEGHSVYGIGRNEPKILMSEQNFYFFSMDLSDIDFIKENIIPFIEKRTIDLAILNAGMLGDIKLLNETRLEKLKEVMDLNVWANKQLIDSLLLHTETKQIVAMSSGASVNGSSGWGGYSLSKATLNMLIKTYAHENEWTHFSAIAPGVVSTPMTSYILQYADRDRFESVRRIQDGLIQSPKQAAIRLISAFEDAKSHPSGSFLDIRTMGDAPVNTLGNA